MMKTSVSSLLPASRIRHLLLLGGLTLLLAVALLSGRPPRATEQRTVSGSVTVADRTLPSRALDLPPAPLVPLARGAQMPPGWRRSEPQQASLWTALSAARHEIEPLAADHAALEANRGVRLFAQNPGQQFTARFLDGLVRLAPGRSGQDWQVKISVPGLASATEIAHEGSRVEYVRGNVIEWYDNRPEGLQQGFIVRHPVPGDGTIRVEVALDGLQPVPAGGDVLHLVDGGGRAILSYSGLLAWDAEGRPLPARMEPLADGVALVVAAAGAAYPVTIDPYFANLQQKVGPDIVGDGRPNARFGSAVALAGTTAVVGAPDDDTPAGMDAGSAYVFGLVNGVWVRQAKLLAGDGAASDNFGRSVAVAGNTIVVGAPNDDTAFGANSGSAYVFLRRPQSLRWAQAAQLRPDDGAANDFFGTALAMTDSTLVVGSPADDHPGVANAGSAYVFTRPRDPASNWPQQAKLVAADGAMDDAFGSAVAISSNTVIIGAPENDNAKGSDAGAAYVFLRWGVAWSPQAKLLFNTGMPNDRFGFAVAISGDTAVVGAPGYDVPAADSGAALVFVRSRQAWSQAASLLPPGAESSDLFGYSVAVSGQVVAVGSPGASAGSVNPDAGAVFTFKRQGAAWPMQSKLQPNAATSIAQFGRSVALAGNLLIGGAPFNNTTAGTAAGSAFLYSFDARNGWFDHYLTAGHTDAGGELGTSVAISKNTIVAGAPYDDTPGGTDAGRVYVLIRSQNTWVLERVFRGNPGAMNDYFGFVVAVSGDALVVGVPGRDFSGGKTDAGTAYAYQRAKSGWTGEVELFRADAEAGDEFGSSVSISDNTALVGAPKDDDAGGGTNAGSAYVFLRSRDGNSWSVQTKLLAVDRSPFALFGYAVSLDKNTALIGAPNVNTSTGCAYVFQRTGLAWSQQAQFFASDGAPNDLFGSAVSLSANYALVGAPQDDTMAGSDAGGAYLFWRKGTAWTQMPKLTANDAAAGDRFGSSVAVFGQNALVGAPLDDLGESNAGSAYNFGPVKGSTGWVQLQKLTDPAAAANDRFGTSLSLSADTAVVGAPFDDTSFGSNTGGVLIFVP